nr:MAG TPA: Troponin C, slow skeletal and thin filament, CONTRACTILE PROTEIN.0A [Bacteriophage sp.]
MLNRIEQLEREKSDLEAVIRKNKHEILWLQGIAKYRKES